MRLLITQLLAKDRSDLGTRSAEIKLQTPEPGRQFEAAEREGARSCQSRLVPNAVKAQGRTPLLLEPQIPARWEP